MSFLRRVVGRSFLCRLLHADRWEFGPWRPAGVGQSLRTVYCPVCETSWTQTRHVEPMR